MSKKSNKKSRLTKTDVNTICEMQRKIDAYESYIKGLFGLAQREKPTERLVFLCGTDLDDEVNHCWRYIKEMKKELIELKENKS